MKNIFTTIIALLIATLAFNQTPEKLSYQSVIKDADGDVLTDQSVGVQISVLLNATDGTSVYTETHSTTTNSNGLLSLEIGGGTSTDDFSAIDWSTGTYFLKAEIDPAGGSDYTISGTTQILSVPYALHAKIAAKTDSASYAEIADSITNASVRTLTVNGGQTINGIARLTGSTSSTENYIEVELPDGYYAGSTQVLSLQIGSWALFLGDKSYYGLGYEGTDGTVGYQLIYDFEILTSSHSIKIFYPSELRSLDFRVILMKI